MAGIIALKSLLSPGGTALGALHRVAGPALRAAGFQWEERRTGDLTIGLWRRTISRRAGPARRLVIVPGFGDTPLSWLTVTLGMIPALRRRYTEIVFVDFPGFLGFLRKSRAFPSMDLLMSGFGDAMDSIRPAALLGHSLGGWLVAHYAAECGRGTRPLGAPKKPGYRGPRHVVIANPSGILENKEKIAEWRGRFEAAKREGFGPFRPHLFKREPAWFRLIAGAFEGFFTDPEIRAFMDSIRADHLLTDSLREIRCQVTFFWGEHDTLVPSGWLADWLRLFEKNHEGDLFGVVLSGAGHSPHLERPVATATALSGIFLHSSWLHVSERWASRLWKIVRA
jgi:pimeloyl-ACP methyl ester carboxylesterase